MRRIINGRKRVPSHLSVPERIDYFASPTLDQNGCRLWLGRVNSDGYANFEMRGVTYSASRTVLEHKLGRPLLAGKESCHTCHVPACVAEDHLYEGDRNSNMKDRQIAGHYATQPKGEGHWCRKLNDDAVRAIRKDSRTQVAIAADYGVTPRVIALVKRREGWKHVV